MSKQLISRKSLYQRQKEAISSLPIHDSQAIADVNIYSALSEDELNKLPSFEENGDIKFYKVGDSIFGKQTLIQFVKSLKTK